MALLLNFRDGRKLFYVLITVHGQTYPFPNYAVSHAQARHNVVGQHYPTRDQITAVSSVRILRWR